MRALKRRLDRSLTAQAVLIFALGVGVTALFRPEGPPIRWLVNSGIYTAVALVFLVVQRRRTSRATGADASEVADLNREIRHGEVPGDPDRRATMRRLVDGHLDQMERAARWLPYWLGFMGLIAVGMLVLGVTTGSLTYSLLLAAGLIVLCCGVLWMRRRSLDRLRRMRELLRSRSEQVA
ncbi:hypothetical protein ACFTZ8_09720 [Streptomyces fungicidicus]|uniref:Uncharacterized protein n=2 Tax=Streptomyces TaxID=1883 RepID=A0A494V0S3_9ACTN|nr:MULTISPECIES: hypothetical protein [Streptomyces]AYL40320.1 hypothetical protein CNQ36_33410 [Streptomyces fungicidicus]EFL37439.1 conserved hypothetical protein [Streptomyces griseoflavus Tu4000]